MLVRHETIAAILTLALATHLSPAARAQDGTSAPAVLPGGASSLTETHGDWIVSCRIGQRDDRNIPICVMTQEQANQRGQRALAIELRPAAEGVAGHLVLPFGLAVTEGVILRIDENPPGERLPFRTCLPAGCIVPVNFDAAMVGTLSQGASLGIAATAINGGQTEMAISLSGFTSALARARALMQ